MATATAPATSPASVRGSATCATSGSTPSGSRPWYPSPLADGGYDVADYRDIDPAFGTLGRGRGADQRGAGARHPHHHRHRPESRLRAATPGSRRRSPRRPARRSASASGSATARGADGDGMPNHWVSPLRRRDLDPHHESRRHARPVVPAPVHAGAARPQLEPPRRAPRARGHPAVLVRPRGRGRSHRLGGAAGQGPAAARGAREPRAGRAPQPGPRRAARHLPRLARGRRLVSGHPRAGRRDLAARDRALREVPAARRDAHRVQLRLHGQAVGCRAAQAVDRHDARRPRAGSGAVHLGAVATTTSPGR